MEIYQSLDKKKYFRVAVLDTEKITQKEHEVKENALAEEVLAKEPYVQAYIRFLLGNVIKCRNIDELRQQSIGVTPDCMLYHGYRLTHMNPDNYTKWAYIGADSVRRRMRELARQQKELEEAYEPLIAEQKNYERLLELEALGKPQRSTLPGRRISGISPGKKRRKQSLTPGFRRSWKEMSSPLRRSFPGSRSVRRNRKSFWTSGKSSPGRTSRIWKT